MLKTDCDRVLFQKDDMHFEKKKMYPVLARKKIVRMQHIARAVRFTCAIAWEYKF